MEVMDIFHLSRIYHSAISHAVNSKMSDIMKSDGFCPKTKNFFARTYARKMPSSNNP